MLKNPTSPMPAVPPIRERALADARALLGLHGGAVSTNTDNVLALAEKIAGYYERGIARAGVEPFSTRVIVGPIGEGMAGQGKSEIPEAVRATLSADDQDAREIAFFAAEAEVGALPGDQDAWPTIERVLAGHGYALTRIPDDEDADPLAALAAEVLEEAQAQIAAGWRDAPEGSLLLGPGISREEWVRRAGFALRWRVQEDERSDRGEAA